jgi:hypothetical protein
MSAAVAWASAAATAPAAPVVVRTGTSTAAGRTTRLYRDAISPVEVRLVLFVELLGLVFVEVLSAFNQDRALIRPRLTLFEFTARL